MTGRSYPATLIWASIGYVILTCLLTFPLPFHLRTHLLGSPSGDTGIYVWNLWIFRHEILGHGHLPLSTEHMFADSGGVDFSLHNYTPIAGLLGLPLIGSLGVVGAYNVVLLVFVASSGLATYLLARRLGLPPAAAWIAGAVFMASPVLTARETAHLSLVTAAPLPLFVWALLRALERHRVRDAVMTGLMVAIASYADPYYGIYCALMGAFLVAWHSLTVSIQRREGVSTVAIRTLEAAIGAIALVMMYRLSNGATDIVLAGFIIKLQTLYTPVLALTVLSVVRLCVSWRASVALNGTSGELRRLAELGAVAVSVCLALLSPVIAGIALRAASGRLPGTEIFWRSSPRGVDLLAYLVPNPNHAVFGAWTRPWLMPDRPDAFPEFVASFSIAAAVVIAVAAWRGALPRMWVVFTGVFVLLSLGPFVHVAGMQTYVIGPWALLRYVPIVGMARSPSRFAIVAVLGASLLVGFALEALWRRRAGSRRAWVVVLGALLAAELLPAPRMLYSAAVPEVYRHIATTGDEAGRLLELPTGIRDGTSSLGYFNPASAFFQTLHRRQMIGGYLSRVSRWRKRIDERNPMLRAIFALSEGKTISREWVEAARTHRDKFLRRSCVRFVVLDKTQASPELRTFAIDVLRLTQVHEDAAYVLFQPEDAPQCDPRPARRGRRVPP